MADYYTSYIPSGGGMQYQVTAVLDSVSSTRRTTWAPTA